MNTVLAQTTTWMKLKNLIHEKTGNHQRSYYINSILYEMFRTGKFIGKIYKKEIGGLQNWRKGRDKKKATANGCGVFFLER